MDLLVASVALDAANDREVVSDGSGKDTFFDQEVTSSCEDDLE